MDGLEWKSLLKWMIWGYPYFRKHPYKLLPWCFSWRDENVGIFHNFSEGQSAEVVEEEEVREDARLLLSNPIGSMLWHIYLH